MRRALSCVVAGYIVCSCAYINDEYREQPISAREAEVLPSIEEEIDRRYRADLAKIEEARVRRKQQEREAWVALAQIVLGGYVAYKTLRDSPRHQVGTPEPRPTVGPSLCLGGDPRLSRDVTDRKRMVRHPGFTASYSDDLHVPLWVCEHLQQEDLRGPAEDCGDCFRRDPLVPADVQPSSADFRRSGYSPVHLAAPANFRHDQGEMDASFLFTNIVPRLGERDEQQSWNALEEAVREYACAYGEVWVITGVGFAGNREAIGAKRVAVPSAFYKVVIRRVASGYRALAFTIDDEEQDEQDTLRLSSFSAAIADIEQDFGVALVPELAGQVVVEQPSSWRRSTQCLERG